MQLNHSLEVYRVFYTVAKCRSITFAANELAISQPAVSQSVKQLEESLETKLFTRTSKGVRLTAEGELLYSYVSKGYEQIVLGEQKLMEMKNLELGEIRIGASDMTLQFFLLPYLEQFHERFPNIKVKVTNAPTPETLSNLEEGRIDFGVVSTPFQAKNTVEKVPVREIGCVVKDFAREYIEEGTLFELRFNKMIPKRQFCIVRNQKNPLSAAAGKLLEIIYANSP